MKKIKLGLIALSALLFANFAQANPCNNFEVKLKNQLPDDFIIHRVQLAGADIQPKGLQYLKARTTQIFTVNNVRTDGMQGILELHSMSIPSRKVMITFHLHNHGLYCHHEDKGGASEYNIHHHRSTGKVTYSIG